MQAAAQIYAAYISTGKVSDGDEERWMQRSVREALVLARATDDAVISESEIDSSEGQNLGNISMGRVRSNRSRHSE